jgi:hypothetical protein
MHSKKKVGKKGESVKKKEISVFFYNKGERRCSNADL